MRAYPDLAAPSGTSRQEQAPARRRQHGRAAKALWQLSSYRQDADAGRSGLQRRLALLELEIAEGREQFARQVDIVSGIERTQGNAAAAREALQILARVHVIRLDERERLQRLLEAALG